MNFLWHQRPPAVLGLILLWLAAAPAWCEGTLQMANLGDFELESGQRIQDSQIEYRTYGVLNEERSNVILFPTWFTGTTQDYIDRGFIGPGKLADSSRFYIVAVGALGNGVSSSPSNSKTQPDRAFPKFSIRDLVHSQYRLLTEVLGIHHLHAVLGFSMGGLQVLEWITSYPEFSDRAVSIVATPRLTQYDHLAIQTEIDLIERFPDPQNLDEAMRLVANVHALVLWTPQFFVTASERGEIVEILADVKALLLRTDPIDFLRQLQAIITHDISRGESFERTAAKVRTRGLFIVSAKDHLVSPQPSLALAKLLGAETLVLEGDCGHMAAFCEIDAVSQAVHRFLN